MSSTFTLARPYAKTVFQYAVESGELVYCADWLRSMAFAFTLSEVKTFLTNPDTTKAQRIALLLTSLVGLDKRSAASTPFPIEKYLTVLAQHNRLMLIPDIAHLYEAMRADHEKKQVVRVESVSPLSAAQKQALTEMLTARLQRKVELELSIDPALIGGFIIRADDLVIDNSIKNKLRKLASTLLA